MFPLIGTTFPQSGAQLGAAIASALQQVIALPRAESAVVVQSEHFPSIEKLKVDLSGASVRALDPPPTPRPAGERVPGPSVAQLEVIAKPIRYEQSNLDLSLSAQDVLLDYARDASGKPLLVLRDARDGQVEAAISKQDLQALVLDVARRFARQQKIDIQDLQLDLRQRSARSAAADITIVAKKLFVTGVISLHGELTIGDDLTATLCGLDATGEGMIGTMAAGLIRPQLQPHNGRQIPLMAFSLGEVALRDVTLSVEQGVRVTARFGSKTTP